MYLCVSFFEIIKFQVGLCNALQSTAVHCNALRHTATHCSTLHQTVRHCNALQHTTTHCNALQPTATHCNTLQRIATHCKAVTKMTKCKCKEIFRCCTLQFYNHPDTDTQHYYHGCVSVWCRVFTTIPTPTRGIPIERVLQCVAVVSSVFQYSAVCCGVLQCVTVRCSALQCVAVCCSVCKRECAIKYRECVAA